MFEFVLAALASAGVSNEPNQKWVRMAGVKVASSCPAGWSCGGGGLLKALPWEIKQYRQMINSPKKEDEPYVPLSEKENKALKHLSEMLLKPANVGENEAVSVDFEYSRSPGAYQPSSFEEVRETISAACNSSDIYSLTDVDDKSERFALLAFHCVFEGKQTGTLLGVALKNGRPVRAYFDAPDRVYGDVAASEGSNR